MTSAFLCSTLSADNSQTVCEIGNLRIKWKIHFHSLISHTTIDNATTARWFANHNGSRLNGLDDDCFPSIFFALILFFFCCLCLIFHYRPRTVDVGIFFLPAPIDQKKLFPSAIGVIVVNVMEIRILIISRWQIFWHHSCTLPDGFQMIKIDWLVGESPSWQSYRTTSSRKSVFRYYSVFGFDP